MKYYVVSYKQAGIGKSLHLAISDGMLHESIEGLEEDGAEIKSITQSEPTIPPTIEVVPENKT